MEGKIIYVREKFFLNQMKNIYRTHYCKKGRGVSFLINEPQTQIFSVKYMGQVIQEWTK